MEIRYLKSVFFAVAIVICCSFSVSSQTKCNLKVDVFELKDDGSSEQFPIKDFKTNLLDTENKKTIKVDNKNGIQTAFDVTQGKYDLTVSKKGFQKTLKKISVNCGLINLQNTVSEIVFLQKGKSNKTFNMFFEGSFGVTRAKSEESETKDINKGAIYLGRPAYPVAAKVSRAKGTVKVQVLLDELGNVVNAEAVSGHPLLLSASVEAAKKSKFRMTYLKGIPVKVSGIITYIYN